MRYDIREGDWVRHRSFPEPIRVIGVGTTIAVQFRNGAMQAFEPSELEKVATAQVPLQKLHDHDRSQPRIGLVGWLALIMALIAICFIALVLLAGR
jgi:hypothetical protein